MKERVSAERATDGEAGLQGSYRALARECSVERAATTPACSRRALRRIVSHAYPMLVFRLPPRRVSNAAPWRSDPSLASVVPSPSGSPGALVYATRVTPGWPRINHEAKDRNHG